jgi:hypothetical protein
MESKTRSKSSLEQPIYLSLLELIYTFYVWSYAYFLLYSHKLCIFHSECPELKSSVSYNADLQRT